MNPPSHTPPQPRFFEDRADAVSSAVAALCCIAVGLLQIVGLIVLVAMLWTAATAATVTGTVRDVGGDLVTNARVTFYPLVNPQIETGGTVLTSASKVVVATNGTFSVTLEQGDYRVQIGSRDAFLIAVPNDAETYSIDSLTTTSLTYTFSIPPASITVTNVVTALPGLTGGKSLKVNESKQLVETGVQITNVVTKVGSVAELLAVDPGDATLVQTLGYYAAGDGGGGQWRWSPSYAGTTNVLGGALSVGGGAWVLDHHGTINVRQWGAVGDGVTDDFDSLQAAADWIGAGMAGACFFPRGVYVLDVPQVAGRGVYDYEVKGPGRYYGADALIRLGSPSMSGQTIKMKAPASGVTWDGISIDGGGIVGENGIGIADNANDIWILNLSVSNCVHSFSIGGGRAVTVQHAAEGGSRRINIQGVSVFNSYAAFDVSGRLAIGSDVEDQGVDGVRVSDCYAYNCEQLIQSFGRNNVSYPQSPRYVSSVFVNIQGRNVGYPTTYPTNLVLSMSSYTASTINTPTNHYLAPGDPLRFESAFGNVDTNTTYYVRTVPSVTSFTFSVTDDSSGSEFDIGSSGTLSAAFNVQWFLGGAIVFDRGGNMVLSNIQIYNDSTYPRLPAVFKGKPTRLIANNVFVRADVQNVVDARTFSETSGRWFPRFDGWIDSSIDVTLLGDAGLLVVAEDGGAAKMANSQFRFSVESLRWGFLEQQGGVKTNCYLSAYNMQNAKTRSGAFNGVFLHFNDFSSEQSDATWNGNTSFQRFDIVRTASTNTAIGTIYKGGLLELRAQAQTLATLGDGLFSFDDANWNGDGKLSISGNRLWFDGGILRTRNGVNPSSVSDGFAIAGRLPVDNRPGDTTFNVLTHSPIQLFTLATNSTVTMSTNNALRGQFASIVRRGSEPYTLNVGPGIKTVPAGMPATVDVVFDGTEWVLWRYEEHAARPQTQALTLDSGNLTITGGDRSTRSHRWTATGNANLVWSGVIDGDAGILAIRPAGTNVNLTLPVQAYGPTGSTLTVPAGSGMTFLQWWVTSSGETNRIIVRADNLTQ